MAMTDLKSDSPIGPKRWRRRIAVGLCFLLVIVAGWRFATRTTIFTRARVISVGLPRAEVYRLLGRPQMTYNNGTTSGDAFTDMTSIELTVRAVLFHFLGIDCIPHIDTDAVRVEYDSSGRVERLLFPPALVP